MSASEARLKALAGLSDHVLTEAEKDSAKRKRPSSPPPTQQEYMEEEEEDDMDEPVARKGPMYHDVDLDDVEEDEHPSGEEDEVEPPNSLPDLHQYFNRFPHISDMDVVSMCRAYASFLASMSKQKLIKDATMNKKRRTRRTN